MADAPDVSPPSGKGDMLHELTEKKWAGIPIAVWFVIGVLALALYLRRRNSSSTSNSGTVVPANAFQLPYLGGYPITITNSPPSSNGPGGQDKDGKKKKDKDKEGSGGQSPGVGPGPDPHFNMVGGTTTTFNGTTSSAPGLVNVNPPAPMRQVSVAAPAPTLWHTGNVQLPQSQINALQKGASSGAGGSSINQAAMALSMGSVPGVVPMKPQPVISRSGPVATVTRAVTAIASIAKPAPKPPVGPVSGVSVNNMKRLTG